MMLNKPLPAKPLTLKRLQRKRVTIAIGSPFNFGSMSGALVCADSRVVASDGATTWGSKMHLTIGIDSGQIKSCFAIAGAADDANASAMLAKDITSALCDDDVTDQSKVVTVVKEQMTAWYSAYGRGNLPSIQFVLAAGVGGVSSLFFCSPPNTVVSRHDPFAIGVGARAVDPLLEGIASLQALPTGSKEIAGTPEPLLRGDGSSVLHPSAESAILRATYWMYRAKRDEGSLCGGHTNLAMVSERGTFAFFNMEEIDAAEALGEEVDKLLQRCRYGLLSWESPRAQKQFIRDFSREYLKLTTKARKITFPALGLLKGLPEAESRDYKD